MSTPCSCCGQTLPPGADAIEAKADELIDACAARAILISFDGYVREADAAALLGKSRYTLRNRRLTDQPLLFRKLGRSAEYDLRELARFVVTGGEIE